MKVKTSSWMGQEIELADYLTPTTGGYDSGGAVEQARELAGKNAKAIGCILAKMVELGQMTFEEAESACDEYGGSLVR